MSGSGGVIAVVGGSFECSIEDRLLSFGQFKRFDLGRQTVKPQAIINRWIVPMEQGVDILALKSGQKFKVPFDTVVIFSTNFRPTEMFDGAALRRLHLEVAEGAAAVAASTSAQGNRSVGALVELRQL